MAVPKVFLRTPFNYDTNQASDESGLECKDASLARQSFAEECDINTIVRRFNLTGALPDNVRYPTSGDFEGVFDFKSAMDVVVAAQQAFAQLPADTRARFLNDPARMLDFVSKDENAEEAIRMGLAVPRKVAPAAPAEGGATPPAPPPPSPSGGAAGAPVAGSATAA